MITDNVKVMAAQAAVEKMARDGYISICTVDTVMKMLKVVADREAYDVLRTLHCVDFRDMDPELRRQIPELLRRVFGGMELQMPKKEAEQHAARRWFGLLRG